MNLSQRVAFNTAVQIASKIITVVFGLLTTILLVNYLGRENYGDYMYIITMVVIFGALADWGTAIIGVREASQAKKKVAQVLGNVFLLRLALSFVAAGLMVIAAFFVPLRTAHPLVVRQGMVLGSLILILLAIKASFGIIFQTKLQMEKLAVAEVTASVLIFFLSWFFIHQGWGLIPLVVAVVLASFVAVLLAWVLSQKTIRLDLQPNFAIIKKLIGESLPMGAILLAWTIDNKIDTVMLGVFQGSGAVGIYAVAYRIYDVLILGAAYLMKALLPVLSGYGDTKKWGKKLRQIYQRTFDVLILMGGGVVFGVLFFAPLMVRIMTQQRALQFFDSALVLRILSVALFLAYFNHLTGFTIIALGKQRPYFFIALGALIFNVLANLFAIPFWSYKGAALVTILTEGLVLFITTIFVFRLIGFVPSLLRFPKTALQLIKQRGKIF